MIRRFRERLSERRARHFESPSPELPSGAAHFEPLPNVEPPSGKQVLRGHNGEVRRVVALSEGNLIATACYTHENDAQSGLRIFSLEGSSVRSKGPLHALDFEFSSISCGLAAAGKDVLACGGERGMIMTCRASTGMRVDTIQMFSHSPVTAVVAVGAGAFWAGCNDGAIYSLSHSDDRHLRVVSRLPSAHDGFIRDMVVLGDVAVTASSDSTAAVWSVSGHKRLAILRGHTDWVRCTAIGERFIATGSLDKSIRLYENSGSYQLVRVLEGIHRYVVQYVEFFGEDLLVSASTDESLVLTSLSTGFQMARVAVGIRVESVAVLNNDRLACVGRDSKAALLSQPALAPDTVKSRLETICICRAAEYCWCRA